MSGTNTPRRTTAPRRTETPRRTNAPRRTGRSSRAARFRLTTRLRLTLVYTGVSILSVVVIFALSFFSLYRTLQQDEVRDMQRRLLSYWAQFQTGGVEFLQQQIEVDNLVVGERPFVVRIADRSNDTLFFSYPQVWESYNVDRLEMLELDPNRLHILRSPDYDYAIEVGGIWLSEEYFLQLGLSTQTRVRLLALFQRNFTLIALAVVVAGFVVGLVIASRALRPIARVTAVAQEIVETGRLDSRVERGTGGSELTDLVDLINRMLERIDRLVEGMRNTVDMVAHDLRTPITRLRAQAELALRSGDAVDMENALVGTVEQSDEVLRFINTLLDITEAESGVMRLDPQTIVVTDLFSEVRDLYELVAEERGITITIEGEIDLTVQGDKVRLRQVVANLVDNAVKYCREGGTVTLSVIDASDAGATSWTGGASNTAATSWIGGASGSGASSETVGTPGMAANSETRRPAGSAETAGASETVQIRVADTGLGLNEEERERVWERMYRGPVQPSQRGLGLGLSFVRAVVIAHGGRAWVESAERRGAEFIVELPRVFSGTTES